MNSPNAFLITLDTEVYMVSVLAAAKTVEVPQTVFVEDTPRYDEVFQEVVGKKSRVLKRVDAEIEKEHPGFPAVTRKKAAQLILLIVDELVSQTVKYRPSEDHTERMAEILSGNQTATKEDIALAGRFKDHEEIYDLCTNLLCDVITPTVGQHPWRVWEVLTVGRTQILHGGEDFRILDFELRNPNIDDYETDNQRGIEFDFGPYINFIHEKLARLLGVPRYRVPVHIMVADVIEQTFPFLIHDGSLDRDSVVELIERHMEHSDTNRRSKEPAFTYGHFVNDVVGPVLKNTLETELSLKLDKRYIYRFTVNVIGRAVLVPDHLNESAVNQDLIDTKEAIERGDYVPSNNRRAVGI